MTEKVFYRCRDHEAGSNVWCVRSKRADTFKIGQLSKPIAYILEALLNRDPVPEDLLDRYRQGELFAATAERCAQQRNGELSFSELMDTFNLCPPTFLNTPGSGSAPSSQTLS
jgi:hypothetical protein